MNNIVKMMPVIGVCVVSVDATTIVFNGCSNTLNSYFTFTAGENEYCIKKCVPNLNPDTEVIVTLKIPGSVDGNQVSLCEEAFNWGKDADFPNLNVNLIFEKVGNTYVQMPVNCAYMFKETTNSSKKISLELGGIATTIVTNMYGMFSGCSALTSIDVRNFNTRNVTNMGLMFSDCFALTSIDVSNFDTSNATNISGMFRKCSGLTSLDVSNFNTRNVTEIYSMFYGCSALTSLDISNFDTSNATNIAYMFNGCSNITALDLGNFDTSHATNMNYMFSGCSKLKSLDISSFDTSKVTTVDYIFNRCTSLLTLSVSERFLQSIENVSGCDSIFARCRSSLKVVGKKINQFIAANTETKSKIDADANKVYIFQKPSAWISDSLKEIVKAQLAYPTYEEESEITNLSKIFTSESMDSLYIAQNDADQTFVLNGIGENIAGMLINKAIDGIGYYPASLQLTGSITLSGDNSGFTQKTLIVGDGVKDTVVTFTDPKALPETDIVVESKGKLVFTGPQKYSITHQITFKSAGLLFSANRIICLNGATIEFAL
ncbi:MAG: BspA family leucine-rich repeat surface protein, partial [Alphaproteobacteria bacterium]|nr:BspA family leucine-rich repeat surface protein [Alphaproteobacteria bacterium]